MSFPPKDFARQASRERRDHRALLATAIARQAAGWTARAMMLSASAQRRNASDDDMGQRIHYFSSHLEGHSSLNDGSYQAFGAFFPQLSTSESGASKGESDVYHSGSTIGKVAALESVPADLQQQHAGHGVSRKL